MNSYKLDSLDKKILHALQENGDLNGSELADVVSSSQASCWRRVKALEDAGILYKSVRLVNRVAVGQDIDVICYLRMKSHSEKDAREFECFVEAQENILECYTMSGEWDYMLRVVSSDIRSYENFLMQTLLKLPSVATANSQFALSRKKYSTRIPIP